MKNAKASSEFSAAPSPFVEPPAYPKTGNEIFRSLKLSVDQAECSPGAHLTQKQFAKLLGMPKSTVNDWYHGSLPPEIRYFICAFERLSDPALLALLRQWCRKCPRLEDSSLSHDPETINRLRNLVTRPHGLTIVRGASDLATFVITALGHSAARLAPRKEIRGLDLHEPGTFVPVNGVLYRRGSGALPEDLVNKLLVDMARFPAQLLLFNGVCEAFPSVRTPMIKLAKTSHVITTGAAWKNLELPTRLLTLSQNSQKRIFIRIETEDMGA